MTKAQFFLTLLIFTVFLSCKKDKTDNEILDYLKANQAAISFSDVKTAQSVLPDSLIRANEVFFLSESHGVASNAQMKLFFLKVVHNQTDTLCYFPELSFAACRLLNQYLELGDETLLQSVYDNYNGTYEYTKENFAFWQQLRSYTQGLTGKKKVIVVGCDLEHQSVTALRYIRQVLGTNTPPAAIADAVNALKTKNVLNYRSDVDFAWLQQQTNAVATNRAVFQQFLGDKLFDLEHTLANIRVARDWANQSEPAMREIQLWENFKKLYPRMPKGKWFGQWGAFHTLQRGTHSSFANFVKIRTESPVFGKVLTIQTLYESGTYRDPFTVNPVAFTNLAKENPLSNLATTDFTLFRLNNTNSPFQQQLLWWGTDEPLNDGVTLNYFQYIFLVKNPSAMTAYK